ncbi:hypothetical protein LguiA_004455 [Lonicera macranthoides]
MGRVRGTGSHVTKKQMIHLGIIKAKEKANKVDKEEINALKDEFKSYVQEVVKVQFQDFQLAIQGTMQSMMDGLNHGSPHVMMTPRSEFASNSREIQEIRVRVHGGNGLKIEDGDITKNNPMTASEEQQKVKFPATAMAKVHCGYKRRKVNPPNASESRIAEQSQSLQVEREEPAELSLELKEAVLQLDKGRSECPTTGGSVSPPEDEIGQVDKSVLTNEGPGPSVSPSSYSGVPPAKDNGDSVDKSVPTNEGPSPSVSPSSGDGVPPAEDDGGPVDKSVPTNEGPGSSVSPRSGGGVPHAEHDGGPVDKSKPTNVSPSSGGGVPRLKTMEAWIADHFLDCSRVVYNMEYTELMPCMCKWKS